jgi:hypothetical protein
MMSVRQSLGQTDLVLRGPEEDRGASQGRHVGGPLNESFGGRKNKLQKQRNENSVKALRTNNSAKSLIQKLQ